MSRKEKLQDLLLILRELYGNENGVKYLLQNYSDVDRPRKIEEGIDIAIEMLYDKMDEGKLLADVAEMLKQTKSIK